MHLGHVAGPELQGFRVVLDVDLAKLGRLGQSEALADLASKERNVVWFFVRGGSKVGQRQGA